MPGEIALPPAPRASPRNMKRPFPGCTPPQIGDGRAMTSLFPLPPAETLFDALIRRDAAC